MTDFAAIARDYHEKVHAAAQKGANAEPEAQLTVPFDNLVTSVAQAAGLPVFTLMRETRKDGIRPDFGVFCGRRFGGYVELKAPEVTVAAETWSGDHNKRQWSYLKTLDAVIVSNGRLARLYEKGEAHADLDAVLPYDSHVGWDAAQLVKLLTAFRQIQPAMVKTVAELARRLAPRARELRDRLLFWLKTEDEKHAATKAAATDAWGAWAQLVHPECSLEEFADGLAQVTSYGLVLAGLSSDAKKNEEGIITAGAARDAIKGGSPVIAAAFGPLLDSPELVVGVKVQLGAIETLISNIARDDVNGSADKRGEPWLYFYEDFLAEYDPDARKAAGVYYTPAPAVQAIVAIAEHLVVERLGKRLGLGDKDVTLLDPAAGTGTFPLVALDRSGVRARALRGDSGPAQVAKTMRETLQAFEILPGPYCVAHLRIGQRLHKMDPSSDAHPRVVLCDTLETHLGLVQLKLTGDSKVLAAEQERARKIKAETRITVVLGNPPYQRRKSPTKKGVESRWFIHVQKPDSSSPFNELLTAPRKAGLSVAHYAGLYNLYVYFWRWSIWKAFEAHGNGPGIVALITGSSWLTGEGFMGLRKLVRELADEIWVLDLGGDNKGSNPEENIFAIESPVAIVVLYRKDASDRKTAATVHYRRVPGTREDKLAALSAIGAADEPLGGTWLDAPAGFTDPMVAKTGGATWDSYANVADLFPWQQPGCKFNRLWPIAPHGDVLARRWKRFAASTAEERPALFQTASSGRDITSEVRGLTRLDELVKGAPSQPIRRYGYRSFDRHWAFDDPRLAKTESPALWQSVGTNQVFLATPGTAPLGPGPAMTVTERPPDMHYFVGSNGGKDILPVFRDGAAMQPNVTGGLLALIGKRHTGKAPTPEDLAAYVYCLLSTPHYQRTFAAELKRPPARLPVTADAALWARAVERGRWLLWLHTFAERYRDDKVTPKRGQHVPAVEGLGWDKGVATMPPNPKAISYDPAARLLRVGDGVVGGVDPAVWAFSVSGMFVVKHWLAYRTASSAGRAATSKNELDNKFRVETWPDEWNDELLDLLRVLTLTVRQFPEQDAILDAVIAGPIIPASELPVPSKKSRKPPKV